MSEKLLAKPLSPNAYKKDTDGPTLTFGFVGYMLADGANVMFEHSSMGATKAINAYRRLRQLISACSERKRLWD